MLRKKNKQHDAVADIVVMGNDGAGKTRLIGALLENDFRAEYQRTTGIDYKQQLKTISGKQVLFRVREYEAGFKSIASGFIQQANFILIVVDTTKQNALEEVDQHLNSIKELSASPTIYIVGSKTDLKDEQKITFRDFENSTHPVRFTSAKQNVGINELAADIGQQALSQKKISKKSKSSSSSSQNPLMLAMGFLMTGLILSIAFLSLGIFPVLIGAILIGGFGLGVIGLGIVSIIKHTRVPQQKESFSSSYTKLHSDLPFDGQQMEPGPQIKVGENPEARETINLENKNHPEYESKGARYV